MLKVAILDDYQNVSQQFVDIEKLSGKYEIKIFWILKILKIPKFKINNLDNEIIFKIN